MSIDVNVQNDLVIVTESSEDIVVNVSNAAGPQGPAGAAGVGVPVGGTTGQVLKKFTNTNYDTYWAADASGLTSVGLSMPSGFSVSNSPLTSNGTISVAGAGTTSQYLRGDGSLATFPTITSGTVTSVNMSVPTGLTISGNPITTSGTLAVGLASGYSIPTTASQATWNTAYNDSIVSAAVTGTTTKTLTLNQQDGGSVTASWSDLNTDAVTSVFGRTGAVVATEGDYTLTQLGDVTLTSPTNGQVLKYNGTTWVNNTDTDTGLTSVGLSMPSAFSVANSPLTSNGTIAVTGAGTSAQYVRGDGQLANFPANNGGGSAFNYYLNGSVSQGTFGGDTYYEMSKTPIAGAGTNFTRTSAQGNGYIASFITDAGDPALLNIPGGNWNVEFYFNASSGGGTPTFYNELYKVSASNVFTLIASGSTNPEGITQGTIVDQYFTSIPVPQTALLATDRIAVRIYVAPDGRNITLHTENSNLCEVLTTFSTGLNALNGLTAQVQYFATGTSGTDFAISSATDTHTFNLPIASGTNTGKLSNTDWTTFNSKQNAITLTTTGSSGASTFISNTLNVPTYTLSGLGGVPTSRTLTINGTAFDLSADRSYSVGTVTSVAALTLGTTGTDLSSTVANGTTTPVITINVPTASATNRGALSSADWTTFNNKQNTITNPVTGTGTTTRLPIWTSSTALGNSGILDNGTSVTLDSRALIGTSAIFTGNMNADDYSMAAWKILDWNGVVAQIGGISASQWTQLEFFTSGTSKMALTSGGNLLVNSTTDNGNRLQVTGNGYFSGNVGIGTTSPGYKLDVNGTFRSNAFWTENTGMSLWGSGSTPTAYGGLTWDTGYAQVYATTGNNLRLGANGTNTYMTINTSGNVGIGTTSPAYKLDIVGTGGFSSSVTATSFIKSGGTSSQYLMADGSVTTGSALTITNRQTASYTLALTDADKLVEMNVATANNLTVPLNSSVTFAIGTKIDLSQYGAGQTTVVATSGVTVRSAGGALKLAVQYSGASLVKIATDEWYLFGDITV